MANTEASLKERIRRTEQNLANLASSLRRANSTTLIVGIILIALLSAYFYYGYREISKILEPKALVEFGEDMLKPRIPEAVTELERQIVKGSPEWAAEASRQLLAAIPSGREKLEEIIVARVDEQLQTGTALSETQFRKFVRDNKAMLKDGVKEISAGDAQAKAFLATLVKAAEEQLGRNFKAEADDVLHILYDLNSKLEQLRADKGLKGSAVHEREVLAIVKRLQLQEADPNLKITAPVYEPRISSDTGESATSSTSEAKNTDAPKPAKPAEAKSPKATKAGPVSS